VLAGCAGGGLIVRVVPIGKIRTCATSGSVIVIQVDYIDTVVSLFMDQKGVPVVGLHCIVPEARQPFKGAGIVINMLHGLCSLADAANVQCGDWLDAVVLVGGDNQVVALKLKSIKMLQEFRCAKILTR
jgi:hypothetical protein